MADTKPAKSTKRRLGAPAQTVREQAVKAQADADKPARGRRLRAAATSSRKPFGRAGKIFHRKPFRILGRILAPKFVRSAVHELRLVSWPDARQTTRLTIAVLLFAIVFYAIIASVDWGLDKLFKTILLN